MRPDHDAEPPARWQQRKSAQTRARLIHAGVECLVEHGYAGLTTASVAERCEVSRGAMHHHYPTRMDLVADVVEHVFFHRMRNFLEDYFHALRERGEEQLVEVACAAHWRSVQTPEYAAYLELATAARTDHELARHFNPAAHRFDEVWTREMVEAFPQLHDRLEAVKLANDLVTAAHMGMVLNPIVFGAQDGKLPPRTEDLQSLLVAVIKGLYAARQLSPGKTSAL